MTIQIKEPVTIFDIDKEVSRLKDRFEKEYNMMQCIGVKRHIQIVRLEDGRSASIDIVLQPL